MRQARLVREGTVMNLAANAAAILSFLSHIDKDGRDVRVPQCPKLMQDSFQDTSLRFLSRDLAIDVHESKFIHGAAVATFDNLRKI